MSKPFKPHYVLDPNVVVLTLFPGIQKGIVASLLKVKGLKAVVLKTYGSGNAPQLEWLIEELNEAQKEESLLSISPNVHREV